MYVECQAFKEFSFVFKDASSSYIGLRIAAALCGLFGITITRQFGSLSFLGVMLGFDSKWPQSNMMSVYHTKTSAVWPKMHDCTRCPLCPCGTIIDPQIQSSSSMSLISAVLHSLPRYSVNDVYITRSSCFANSRLLAGILSSSRQAVSFSIVFNAFWSVH